MERRRSHRLYTSLPLWVTSTSGQVFGTRTTNISLTGLEFYSPSTLSIHDHIALEIEISATSIVRCSGVVIRTAERSSEHYTYSVKFAAFVGTSRLLLRDMLIEQLTAELNREYTLFKV